MPVRLGRVSILDFVSKSEVMFVTLVSLVEMNKRIGSYVLKC
jgi:hypothetical protein